MEFESHTPEEIIKATKEAASWCEVRWNPDEPRSPLRNLEFSPEFFGTNHYHTANSIMCFRRYELESLDVMLEQDLSKGRIFVCEPDSNISDGVSEHETDGYLDVNDCPSWDTWVGYVLSNDARHVLSRVPKKLVPLVNAGAAANCVDCFYWLSEVKGAWAKELNNVFQNI